MHSTSLPPWTARNCLLRDRKRHVPNFIAKLHGWIDPREYLQTLLVHSKMLYLTINQDHIFGTRYSSNYGSSLAVWISDLSLAHCLILFTEEDISMASSSSGQIFKDLDLSLGASSYKRWESSIQKAETSTSISKCSKTSIHTGTRNR